MLGNIRQVVLNINLKYSAGKICLWSWQIASGVEFLHKNQLIHGNINPTNILISEGWSMCKIGGFGSLEQASVVTSMITDECSTPLAITTDSEGKSFAYDVYSVALTIWEIVHRRRRTEARPASDSEIDMVPLGPLITRCYDQESPLISDVVNELKNKKEKYPDKERGPQL